MARVKTSTELITLRKAIVGRLTDAYAAIMGPQTQTAMAEQLGVNPRTWINYARGEKMPGEIMLRFLHDYGIEASWLLRGEGPMLRRSQERTSSRVARSL